MQLLVIAMYCCCCRRHWTARVGWKFYSVGVSRDTI